MLRSDCEEGHEFVIKFATAAVRFVHHLVDVRVYWSVGFVNTPVGVVGI